MKDRFKWFIAFLVFLTVFLITRIIGPVSYFAVWVSNVAGMMSLISLIQIVICWKR